MWRYKHGISKLKTIMIMILLCLFIVVVIKMFSQPNLPNIELTQVGNMPANIHFILETTVTDLPYEETVYQVETKEFNNDDAKLLAQTFGLVETFSYNDDENEWLAYQNGELLIINGSDGSWIYRNLGVCQKKYTMNITIPDDEAIVDLAKEYLNKLGINSSNFSTTAVGSTITSEKLLQKSIYFYQDVNGYDILGSPQLIVDIGDNGQLEGITNYYYEFKEYETFKLKLAEQAISELQSRQGRYIGPETLLGDAIIYDVTLAYCQSMDVNGQQIYLVPVFLFNGEVESQSGPAPFSALVPAVRGLTFSN